jgi:hypothetical protein
MHSLSASACAGARGWVTATTRSARSSSRPPRPDKRVQASATCFLVASCVLYGGTCMHMALLYPLAASVPCTGEEMQDLVDPEQMRASVHASARHLSPSQRTHVPHLHACTRTRAGPQQPYRSFLHRPPHLRRDTTLAGPVCVCCIDRWCGSLTQPRRRVLLPGFLTLVSLSLSSTLLHVSVVEILKRVRTCPLITQGCNHY